MSVQTRSRPKAKPKPPPIELADVELPEYAAILWDDSYRHYAFHGGRGGGKSWAIARALLILGAEKPLRIACCREIQKNINESVYQLLCDQIAEMDLGDHYEILANEIKHRFHETVFTFHGLWRNPSGLKSMEGYDYCWIEEAAGASKQSIKVLIPTLRRETSKFIWSWNPEFPEDAVEKLFRDEAKGPPPRTHIRKVLHSDNPWFPDVLREEMERMYEVDPDQAAHVYGGEYVTTVDGAYFAKQLREARDNGRMGEVVRDPDFEVRTFWDLGHSDATAIWVAQFVGERIHIIDYCEGSGQPPGYYMNWLRANGYAGAKCILPHDGASVHPDNPIAMSYEAQLKAAGFPVDVVRNQGRGAAQQRIDAMRKHFPRIWFNEDACKPGIRALGYYHEKVHEESKARMGPEHDWSSHAADAAGLIAITYKAPEKKLEKPPGKPKRRSQWAL